MIGVEVPVDAVRRGIVTEVGLLVVGTPRTGTLGVARGTGSPLRYFDEHLPSEVGMTVPMFKIVIRFFSQKDAMSDLGLPRESLDRWALVRTARFAAPMGLQWYALLRPNTSIEKHRNRELTSEASSDCH